GAGEAEAIGINLEFRGVLFRVADGRFDVLVHFGRGVTGLGAGPRGEYYVAPRAVNCVELGDGVVADFVAVGIPRATDHVHDSEPVGFAIGSKDVHQQTGAVNFAVNDVLALFVGRALPGDCRCSDQERTDDESAGKPEIHAMGVWLTDYVRRVATGGGVTFSGRNRD